MKKTTLFLSLTFFILFYITFIYFDGKDSAKQLLSEKGYKEIELKWHPFYCFMQTKFDFFHSYNFEAKLNDKISTWKICCFGLVWCYIEKD